MNLIDKQKELLNRRSTVALATASKDADPQVAFVEVHFVGDDEIIFTDNQMATTRKNILETKKVVVMAFEEDYSYCLKIFGTAEYHTEGKWFEYVKQLEDNKEYSPKGAIAVKIDHVIEFS